VTQLKTFVLPAFVQTARASPNVVLYRETVPCNVVALPIATRYIELPSSSWTPMAPSFTYDLPVIMRDGWWASAIASIPSKSHLDNVGIKRIHLTRLTTTMQHASHPPYTHVR
jgi:hypothetical protein